MTTTMTTTTAPEDTTLSNVSIFSRGSLHRYPGRIVTDDPAFTAWKNKLMVKLRRARASDSKDVTVNLRGDPKTTAAFVAYSELGRTGMTDKHGNTTTRAWIRDVHTYRLVTSTTKVMLDADAKTAPKNAKNKKKSAATTVAAAIARVENEAIYGAQAVQKPKSVAITGRTLVCDDAKNVWNGSDIRFTSFSTEQDVGKTLVIGKNRFVSNKHITTGRQVLAFVRNKETGDMMYGVAAWVKKDSEPKTDADVTSATATKAKSCPSTQELRKTAIIRLCIAPQNLKAFMPALEYSSIEFQLALAERMKNARPLFESRLEAPYTVKYAHKQLDMLKNVRRVTFETNETSTVSAKTAE